MRGQIALSTSTQCCVCAQWAEQCLNTGSLQHCPTVVCGVHLGAFLHHLVLCHMTVSSAASLWNPCYSTMYFKRQVWLRKQHNPGLFLLGSLEERWCRYKPVKGPGLGCFLLLVKSEGFLGWSQSAVPALPQCPLWCCPALAEMFLTKARSTNLWRQQFL